MISEETILSLAESLHPLEKKVLTHFRDSVAHPEQAILDADSTLQPSQLSMALGWLQAKEILAISEETKEEWVSLTPLGEAYARNKNPFLQISNRERGP